jgi:peptidoglycan L-alanyl-D-glutamate endopeptidase CwlK
VDLTTKNKIAKLHPKIRLEVAQIVEEIEKVLTGSAKIRINEGFRSFDYQNGLYALGRTKINPDGKSPKKPLGNVVTNARAGSSFHNYGLAVDFCLIIDGKVASWNTLKDFDGDKVADWNEVVKIFKAHNFVWGGDFRSILDKPHFEKPFGFTWRQLLEKYNAGKTFKDSGEIYVTL